MSTCECGHCRRAGTRTSAPTLPKPMLTRGELMEPLRLKALADRRPDVADLGMLVLVQGLVMGA